MKLNRYINYLRFEKRFSEHTVEAYRTDIISFSTYLYDTFGLTSAIEVRPFHLRSFLASLMEKGISNRSISRKKSALNRFFTFLLKDNQISDNPAARLPALKSQRSLPDIIPAADLEKMLSSPMPSDDFWALRNRTICWMLYATGLRRAELISLHYNQIDTEGITFIGKGQKERFVPFSKTLMDVMKRYLENRNVFLQKREQNSDFLFFSHSFQKLNPKTVYNVVNEELSLFTSVRKKSPHMLRHAFATHLLDEGADISSVQKLLGHAGLGSTQAYTQVSINRLKNAHAKAHPRNSNSSPKK